jgi:hypothetical protein
MLGQSEYQECIDGEEKGGRGRKRERESYVKTTVI